MVSLARKDSSKGLLQNFSLRDLIFIVTIVGIISVNNYNIKTASLQQQALPSKHHTADHEVDNDDDNEAENKVDHDTPSSYQKCIAELPEWVENPSAAIFKKELDIGSTGLSDKTDTNHNFQHMYHRYLSDAARKTCHPGESKKIRFLEIGLGCNWNGGMIRGTPGGSALAWRHMFPSPQFEFDLHLMEFDADCANKWAETHKDIATVHTGDASDPESLERIVKESGGQPFDVIIDDASHVNAHQIATFEHMHAHVAHGGLYIIEDIFSSCASWSANTGRVKTGLRVKGTPDCMETTSGEPTIYSKIVEWQKLIIMEKSPFPDVNHIDVCLGAVAFQKQI